MNKHLWTIARIFWALRMGRPDFSLWGKLDSGFGWSMVGHSENRLFSIGGRPRLQVNSIFCDRELGVWDAGIKMLLPIGLISL
jgi:hypothetical protein